jgi:hypothetical protein
MANDVTEPTWMQILGGATAKAKAIATKVGSKFSAGVNDEADAS